jgi:hypothetical protein
MTRGVDYLKGPGWRDGMLLRRPDRWVQGRSPWWRDHRPESPCPTATSTRIPHGVFAQDTRMMRVSRTQQTLTLEATYEDEVPCVIPGQQARAGSGSGTPFLLQPG